MPLINCEVDLILAWSSNCVITSKEKQDADPDDYDSYNSYM